MPYGSSEAYATPDHELPLDQTTGERYQLASRRVRLIAFLADMVILTAVVVPASLLAFGILFPVGISIEAITGNSSAFFNRNSEDPDIIFEAMRLVMALAIYLIINGYLLIHNGQTVAKKLFGIKIVSTDGSPASLNQLVGRRIAPFWFVTLVPILGGLVQLIDWLAIFRNSKLCLHDNFADTVVVRA